MGDYDYDLFVIGGGSGGVRAARQAAATGARVGLAESSRMGGTCVIRGCVPKKLMVFASGYRELVEDAKGYGWEIDEGRFDWPAFRQSLHGELDRLEGVYRKLLDNSGVEIHDTHASLEDGHTVRLESGGTKSARVILIATGGRPVRPAQLGDAEHGLVSDDIFDLEELPKELLILGGGYIACEFACILNGLGVKVSQFYRGAQILRGFDEEARGLIAESMKEHGIDLHVGTNIVEMDRTGDGRTWVKATNGAEHEFDAVLFATGRAPNTETLNLAAAGIETGRRGQIVVDEYSATSCPSVYAIGDVTDRLQLTPVAIREGMAFVDTVFRDKPTPVDHELVPSAVFTQPELGTIGMTEEQARDLEPVEVYCTSFRPMQTAFIGRPDRVLMKLIVSRATRRILGCHIVAPEAGEMIQLAGIAIKMGATKEDFDRTVAVHPTMAEEIVTMREPVRAG
ncbi:glutathione-disulfide reductase [Oceanicola granulosus HTCC2516]|uniref:Glutathione-disulfide reductase n=1 Tax=Oceanicola granulosus (strain ATCC BAA-861 / DSM 15982 / KCTC 12143 / HTCC2516) TaxID=314256 RepID=Q2CFA4_OCEGH|nr:glutathione-disulfide reductase [Oceanicola granulosus]EAR51391.1 glutathione-disulfide reductase [Oceanicola granulosus HTCC2516]